MTSKEFAILLSLAAAAAAGAALPVRAEKAQATCDEQPVYSIEAGNLEFGTDTIVVNAYGMASTLGWKSPALKRLAAGGDPATMVYAFVACRPAFGAEVMTPISATATIATGAGGVKHVVIKAKTNSQTLDVAEFQRKLRLDKPQVE